MPAAALLDPVANTLDLRQPFSAARAARVHSAMHSSGVGLSDLGYFDNMLAADESARGKKHAMMLRVFDAAVLLGTDAVCGFVGRNPLLEMDANLAMFEQVFVPLLQEAKARGLTFRVEQCPMPGWNITDKWLNNIAYAPGPWIALHRICERHGVGDQFRIHYDPSHAILMGQDSRSVFQVLKDTGYNFLISGFHVKGQVIDSRGISAWGYGGQTMQRGDWYGDRPSSDPAEQQNAWKKQTVFSEHELPGTARHDPLAYLQNRSVDWLDHQLAARELLRIEPRKPSWSWNMNTRRPAYKIKPAWQPILAGSLAFTRAIDAAAAAMYALQHEVLASRALQYRGSVAKRIGPDRIEAAAMHAVVSNAATRLTRPCLS